MDSKIGQYHSAARFYFLVGGLALALGIMACGSIPGFGGAGVPPTPTLMALPGVGGTESGGGEAGSAASGETLSFLDPQQAKLTSFRAKFTLTYNGTDSNGKAIQGSFTMEQAHTANPLASSLKWQGQGADMGTQAQGTEMVQIGEVTYIVTVENGAPKCVSYSSQGNVPTSENITSPGQFLSGSDLSHAQRVLPDEVVNGVLSRHYHFDKSEVALTGTGLTSYTVDVWTAVDGGYTVRGKFAGDGQDLTFKGGQGHVEWTYDVLEVNTPIEIKMPDGCEAPAGADFPKLADAADVTSIGGIISFTTAKPTADVIAFYQAQLPPLGWTAGETKTDVPGMATMTFTKEGKTANITITESNGKTNVIIQIQ